MISKGDAVVVDSRYRGVVERKRALLNTTNDELRQYLVLLDNDEAGWYSEDRVELDGQTQMDDRNA